KTGSKTGTGYCDDLAKIRPDTDAAGNILVLADGEKNSAEVRSFDQIKGEQEQEYSTDDDEGQPIIDCVGCINSHHAGRTADGVDPGVGHPHCLGESKTDEQEIRPPGTQGNCAEK